MKIFAAGIGTETNTFSSIPTSLEDFSILRGKDSRKGLSEESALDLSANWGRQACERGDEFVFSLMAFAQPSGITVRSAYESLRDEVLRDLRAALPVDIVLLNLHGAMVAEGYEDCEEDLIRRARVIAGTEAVIGVELDLHCHLTESKIADANVVVTYKEYPHTDVNERARELFDLAVRARLGAVRPTTALFDCRMIGIYRTTGEPMRSFVNAMTEGERRDGVLSISLGHGFHFADLPSVGAKVLAVTNNNLSLAAQVAREFGAKVHTLRARIGFEILSLSLDEALSRALASTCRPVVVADQSDNPGSGAPGDATYALRWLLEHKAENAALAILYDPEVVRIAKKAGVGARLPLRLGGKLGPSSGIPVDIEVTVLSIRENYMHPLPQESGNPWLFPAGNVIALRCGTIDIIVSSERCQCFAPSIFTDLGIDPKAKQLLIVKSYQHFYGAFAAIAGEVIYMAAPGAVPPDPTQISYKRLDTSNLYPWVQNPTLPP